MFVTRRKRPGPPFEYGFGEPLAVYVDITELSSEITFRVPCRAAVVVKPFVERTTVFLAPMDEPFGTPETVLDETSLFNPAPVLVASLGNAVKLRDVDGGDPDADFSTRINEETTGE